MSEYIFPIVVACIGSSGLASVIVAILNRKWSKADKEDAQEDERIKEIIETQQVLMDMQIAQAEAQRVLMVDRIHWLSKQYISRGCISMEEKERFMDIHKAYQKLGGENCHVPVTEVNKLPVTDECE